MKELTDYLRKAHRSPLRIIRHDLPCASEKILSDLKTHIPNPPLRERVRRAWIYDETWAAMDAGVTARQEGAHRTIQKIGRCICVVLSMDRKRHVEYLGHTFESCLISDPPLIREAWFNM